MEVIAKYFERYKEFAKIDDFNLEQRTKQVINEKQFFLSEWAKTKVSIFALNKTKSKVKDTAAKKIVENGPVSLTKKTLDNIENFPAIEEINEKIKEQELVLQILDQIVKQISFIGTDIKNIIDATRINNM